MLPLSRAAPRTSVGLPVLSTRAAKAEPEETSAASEMARSPPPAALERA